jgi:tRNA nucleotidyltransferase/poly(A) polymerase
MDELLAWIRSAVRGEEAWVVGGALRDEVLRRPVLDVDVACRDPVGAARAFAGEAGGAPFPLSERHGAWRTVLADGRTVDFTPLAETIERDLAARDFTINALAREVEGTDLLDPHGGLPDLAAGTIRTVSTTVFAADPLRLLRAVRLEDELGFRCDPETEALVRSHVGLVREAAGERVLDELERLSVAGFLRLDELGLLAALGGTATRAGRAHLVDTPDYRLVSFLAEALFELPISRRLARYARTLLAASPPTGDTAREIHRFRRATEPWAVDALAFVDAFDLAPAIAAARAHEPAEPLLRGDELGLPPGPEIGRVLEEIAEERAAGVVSTREEALELVRRRAR